MTLEELFLQGMDLLPSLTRKEDIKKQLKELVAEKESELKMYKDQLKALKEDEEELLEGIKDALESKGLDSIKLGGFTVTVVAGKESVCVEEGVDPDREFVKVVKTPKKKEVMAYFKANGVWPKGFKAKKGKSYLRITPPKKEEDDEENKQIEENN